MYLDQLQLGLVGVTDVGNKRWCFRFLGTLADLAEGRRATLAPVNMLRLLQVLCNDGARMCELRSLAGAQVDLAKGAIILARGKNGRPRVIVLSRSSLQVLQVQIDLYGDGLLFPNPRTGRPFLHTSASRIAATAEIKKPTEVTCHTPRRSFADSAHQAGGSIEEIALTLGNTPEVVLKHYLSRSVSPSARRINRLMNPEG